MWYRGVLAAFLVLALPVPTGSGRAEDPFPPGPQPAVTRWDGGLVLEWQTPDVEVLGMDGGRAQVQIPGFETLDTPGAPQIPWSAVLLALPQGVEPQLSIEYTEERVVDLPGALDLAPQPAGVQRAPDGTVLGGAFAPAESTASFQAGPVVLERLGTLRDVALARLIFYPARPEGDDLRLTTSLRVRLTFPPTVQGMAGLQAGGLDELQTMLQSMVINPEDVLPAPAAAGLDTEMAAAQTGQTPVVAVEVQRRGLIALDYDSLAAAGFPVDTVDTKNLQLTRSGAPVAYEWEGDDDSVFERGERLVFFADPRFSRWTSVDVYFLHADGQGSLWVTERKESSAGKPLASAWRDVTLEENRIYTPDCYCGLIPAGRDGDRWVWERLQWSDQVRERSFPFELTAVHPDQTGLVDLAAQLTLHLIGFTDVPAVNPDHRLQVSLNGTVLGVVEWDGQQTYQNVLDISKEVLKEGQNVLTLSAPAEPAAAVDGSWLDAFTIRYKLDDASTHGTAFSWLAENGSYTYTFTLDSAQDWRLYDISDPLQPVRVTGMQVNGNQVQVDAAGGEFFFIPENEISLPENLRLISPLEQPAGADYIILTHSAFLPALQPLIDLRTSQGLSVVVQDVQGVYDNFGDGRPDPQALYSYLLNAYRTWRPRPQYVLLVGDGTADPRQYQSTSPPTWIPPYLADVDPWAGETAADNRYATLAGTDNLPELMIGRLPVNSLAEAQAVIAKIVAYETSLEGGFWREKAVFIADNPDGGGNYHAQSDLVAQDTGALPHTLRRLYFDPDQGATGEDMFTRIESAWNNGVALVMYSGHASMHQWAAERFIHIEDIASLENGSRLPVLLDMTCFTGSFHSPSLSTLDEAFLRHPSGGAAAVWGSSGLGISTGHRALAQGFTQSVWRDGGATLGEAALIGKINLLASSQNYLDLIDTYVLFGDPAMHVQIESITTPTYLPLTNR